MQIKSLDHLVLTVRNIDTTTDFYVSVLGMEKVIFGDDRHALHFGNQKINLHQSGGDVEPKALFVMPGSADLCFLVEQPIAEVAEDLRRNHVEIIDGPVMRTGAMGKIQSVYFRDPDGNLIELANQL